jgi:hypothetical protein
MGMKVLRFFVEEGELPTDRIMACGESSYRALGSNKTMLSRAKNSRVDIVLRYDAPAYVKRIYKRAPSGIFSYKRFDFKLF